MQMVIETTVDDGTPIAETLSFSYDASGLPMSVVYNGTAYYYTVNLQGDVMAIVDATGNAVVSYAYDAWGNILSVTGTMAETLGKSNPLRYRGYIYDPETGLYYLQSRYYDPDVGRFINADNYPTTGQGLTGNNMFAYCGNNPVARKDATGEFWEIIAGAAIGGAIAGAFISAASYLVSCGINDNDITFSGVLGAVASGAVTGAIGAVGGALGGVYAVVASVGVGIITGSITAFNTEGPTKQKVVTGITTGLIASMGTFLGTKIPIAKDDAFVVGVTSFAGGLWIGTQAEIINVTAQTAIAGAFASGTSSTPILPSINSLSAQKTFAIAY